jgi:hypothetical protein
MREAKSAIGGYLQELKREEFAREFVPSRFVDGSEQLAHPGEPNGGLGEITWSRHGER